MMDEFLKPGSLALDLVSAGAVFSGFLLGLLLIRALWMRVLRPFVARTQTDLDDTILTSLRGLVLWGVFMLGLYYALSSMEVLQSKPRFIVLMGKTFGIAWVALAVVAAIRLFSAFMGWYVRKEAAHPEHARDLSHQASLLQKVVTFLALVLGLLYVLRIAGVDISPLLASGAIGGLAVALALQDTLSNLFAGFFLNIDRPVKVGDFVKLESGEEGLVQEIGWRNTKICMLANNVVVVPNSKLSQSTLTNYYLPRQELSVPVPCGVAYDSDLQRVEDVAVEVGREVMQRVPGAAPDWQPVVRWKEFGDFAINFVTVLRAREFTAQFALQSEFIKALHKRFNQEGIEIPFPIRTVIMKSPSPDPQTQTSRT
ncbi:MAG: mechanosensitive ion channel family protein [Planctomycetes bacterium]|nr:mechanosensitive ion channel family protein [Planctomycetota bacterium]